MFNWFRAKAPIRRKFDTLFVVYVGLAALSAAIT